MPNKNFYCVFQSQAQGYHNGSPVLGEPGLSCDEASAEKIEELEHKAKMYELLSRHLIRLGRHREAAEKRETSILLYKTAGDLSGFSD